MQRRPLFLLLSTVLLTGIWSGCSAPASDEGQEEGNGDGDGDGITIGGGDGDLSISGGQPWPGAESPVLAAEAPAGVQELFAGAATGAGCVTEPQDQSMIPRNWLRPRFRVAGGAAAYMVVLSSDAMEQDLVGYGGPDGFKLPLEYWRGIASRAGSAPVTVNATLRAHDGATGYTESTTSFHIAPASAGGAMVYWASSTSKDNVNSSLLYGFGVGEEGVVEALKPAQVTEDDIREQGYLLKANGPSEFKDDSGAPDGKVTCIGCHTSTPDGESVAFNNGYPWNGIMASIEEETVGQRPDYVTELGARLLNTPFMGTITFSKGDWDTGRRYAVSTITPWMAGPYAYEYATRNLASSADLIWVDLAAPGSGVLGTNETDAGQAFIDQEGAGWGRIARTGDTGAAAMPAWSNSGTTIAYTSTNRVAGSHLGGIDVNPMNDGKKLPDLIVAGPTTADLYTVPFEGGTATPIAGASEPGYAEYYPDWSPDDSLIAFNKAIEGSNTAGDPKNYVYYRVDAEITVLPSEGGTPVRLAANDPPACTGEPAANAINSWPKWGPSTSTAGGDTYYWLIFSSARAYPDQFEVPRDYYTPLELDTRSSQLYLAAVVKKADGSIETFPGVYVWNQTTTTSNLTPAWDEFKIPPVDVR